MQKKKQRKTTNLKLMESTTLKLMAYQAVSTKIMMKNKIMKNNDTVKIKMSISILLL